MSHEKSRPGAQEVVRASRRVEYSAALAAASTHMTDRAPSLTSTEPPPQELADPPALRPAFRLGAIALGAYVATFEMLKFPLSGFDPRHVGWTRWHDSMLRGTQGAPNRYRVLSPWIAEGLHRLGLSVFDAYTLLHFVAFAALGVALDHLWRRWLGPLERLVGVLLVMLSLALSYVPVIQPSDALNALFFALAADALASRRWTRLAILAAVASLNKQTAVFLAPLVFFQEFVDRETPWPRRVGLALLRGGVVFACVAVVQGALRMSLGRSDYYTDLWQYRANVRWMSESLAGWNFVWMSVLPTALVFATWRRQPRLLHAYALTMPFFVLGHFLIAIVAEVRVFTPMLALGAAGVLIAARADTGSD